MRPERVLVIDDSQEIHDLLAVRLRAEGVELHHSLTGDDGLTKAVQLLPDLILLDVSLPNMTGFEVCQKLKNDPLTNSIPVIFLTAAGEVYAKVQGFDLGAIDYVTKPFDAAELRARVRAGLRTKRYQDLLAARAHVDALTTLWNRAYFDRKLADEINAVRRYGRVVALLMIDLDHFKPLNDNFGHPFGDRVLQAVGDLLWHALRTVDAPCRFGGEEFACIMTETSLAGALRVAQRIRELLHGLEFFQKGQRLGVTASMGVAATELMQDRSRATSETLIQLADDALYVAKRSGRDRIECAEAARSGLVGPFGPDSAAAP